MIVVSSAGQVLTSHVVLPGKETKYYKCDNGKFETTSAFLANPNCLYMRPVTGVETSLSEYWELTLLPHSLF